MLNTSMPADTEHLDQRIARLSSHFTITRPDRPGPAPVVILMHGCGGPRPFFSEIANVVAKTGAAAILVDSFAPRRIGRAAALATVCTGARLQGRERAGDLFAAMAWARGQDWIDSGRIVAAGWSHGGWTLMDAMALRPGAEMQRATGLAGLPGEPLEGLAAAMIVYPYAGIASYAGRRDWRIAPRSIAILAGRDLIVGVKTPRAALERQRLRGAPLEIHHFETATHAFEDPEAEDPRVRHDPIATAREHALLRELVQAL